VETSQSNEQRLDKTRKSNRSVGMSEIAGEAELKQRLRKPEPSSKEIAETEN
jgi:hypothetical protein